METWDVCLTLTRDEICEDKKFSVLTTDEWALAYASNKLNVPEDELELERDGALIRIRRVPSGEETVDLLSYDQWMYEVYGFPDKEDEFHSIYKEFGYTVWLVNKHPDVWAETGITRADINAEHRISYNWYMLEEVLGCDGETIGIALDVFLLGQPLVTLVDNIQVLENLNINSGDVGILAWTEDSESLCLFDDDGKFIPLMLKHEQIEITDDVFYGWE